jgi:hypothetical protein
MLTETKQRRTTELDREIAVLEAQAKERAAALAELDAALVTVTAQGEPRDHNAAYQWRLRRENLVQQREEVLWGNGAFPNPEFGRVVRLPRGLKFIEADLERRRQERSELKV